MVETRIAPRFRVLKDANIEHGGHKRPCKIRDLSTTGAALELPDLSKIPETFMLSVPEDGLRLECRVVWRRDFKVGVTFI